MPINCPQCLTQNADNTRFCRTCGSALATTGNPVPSQPIYSSSDRPSWQSPSSDPSFGGYSPSSGYGAPGGYGDPPGGPSMDYAMWPNRVAGDLIDYLLVFGTMAALYFVFFIVFSVLGGIGGAMSDAGAQDAGGVVAGLSGLGCCVVFSLFPIATLVAGLYNKVYLVSTRGASLGQGLMKLRVVDAQGHNLTMGNAAIRLLARVGLSFIPIVGTFLDLLWPLWDEKRQTLHDKAVGSFVINKK